MLKLLKYSEFTPETLMELQKRRNLERLRKTRQGQPVAQVKENIGDDGLSVVTPDPEPEAIAIPKQHDVLLGRGKRYYEHVGNVRFRQAVEAFAPTYNSATAAAKQQMTLKIVELVHRTGGRFLKDGLNSGWVEVDDEVARQKVSHVFRNLRLAASKQARAAAVASTTKGAP